MNKGETEREGRMGRGGGRQEGRKEGKGEGTEGRWKEEKQKRFLWSKKVKKNPAYYTFACRLTRDFHQPLLS